MSVQRESVLEVLKRLIHNFKRRSITLEIMEELSEFNVIFYIIDSIIGFKGIVVN